MVQPISEPRPPAVAYELYQQPLYFKNKQGKWYEQAFFYNRVFVAFLLGSISAQAQSLWGGTTVGMTPTQVVETVKGSRYVSDDGRPVTDSLKLVQLDDFLLVNESFEVDFRFSQNRLVKVTLALKKERPFSSTMELFNSLTGALRTRYGNEISRIIEPDSLLKRSEATWVSGRTNITLVALGFGDNPAHLFLTYGTVLSQEADKL